MSTARCYACHSLRPIYEFPYRRRDAPITGSARIKRYVGILLQKPGASTHDRRGSGGVIYRYRCVHPRAGRCPVERGPGGYATVVVATEEVRGEGEDGVGLERRTLGRVNEVEDEVGRDEIEIEVAVATREEEEEFRRQKEEALNELRQQCVDATDSVEATR